MSQSSPDDRPALGVLLDMSALLALGAGSQTLSRLIVAATNDTDKIRRVYTPAMCLAAATAHRPALARHVAGLPIDVLDLGFAEACASGELIAAGTSWQLAHALVSATQGLLWPQGLPVYTAEPDPYAAWGIKTRPV